VEVVASLSQGLTAAAQCDLFTHKSVPVIFEPPCILQGRYEFLINRSTFYIFLLLCLHIQTLQRKSYKINSFVSIDRAVP